jgi:hypothetical protein
VAADLRRIYRAATADPAAAELDAFEEKWAGKYASLAPAWRRAWQEVIPFFAFDPAIRKIIYTTNAIESLNRLAIVLEPMAHQRLAPEIHQDTGIVPDRGSGHEGDLSGHPELRKGRQESGNGLLPVTSLLSCPRIASMRDRI